MLYIEKTGEPQIMRARVAAIKSSSEWKKICVGDTEALRGQFDLLPKEAIRQSLLAEQHGLCAYCMKRMENNERHTTIEHWSPLSKDKDNALDYRNFLAVCKGGADVSGEARKRILCCDASKGNAEVVIDPLDREMMSHIVYKKTGEIAFKPKTLSGRWTQEAVERVNQEINHVLCLNGRTNQRGSVDDTATCVVKGRKDAWTVGIRIMERLQKEGRCTSGQIRKKLTICATRLPEKPSRGSQFIILNASTDRWPQKRKASKIIRSQMLFRGCVPKKIPGSVAKNKSNIDFFENMLK